MPKYSFRKISFLGLALTLIAAFFVIQTYQSTASAQTDVFLSDLTWISTQNGWGPVERDKSNGEKPAGDGRTITLNGVTYAKGLGVHAYSEVIYNLGGGYSNFLSDVGVDDEACGGSVIFQVFADGIKLYDSGLMKDGTATKAANVDLTGRNQLKLMVTDGGNGMSCDHADWAGARIRSSSEPSPPDTTPPSTPTGLTATPVSSSKIDLSWNISTDDVAVTGYQVYRSGSFIAAATSTNYQNTGLIASTAYAYQVSAIDEAGNESPLSSSASTTTPEPPPFNAKINFQLSGTPVPTGYLADYGSTYADRGNGFTYGWDISNTANARDRGVLSDQRYDTLNHMQKSGGGSVWELQVPNGTYQVRIVSGDPSYIDSVYKINVEGQLAINNTPIAGTKFFENTVTVTVSDGRLTISNASGASNNKINFIEVVLAAPPPPAAPSVTTLNATNIATSTATLNGSANPNNDATTSWFRYSSTNPGTCDDVFGTRVPVSGGTNLGSGSSPVSYLENISALTPATTYYYCALAENPVGTGIGLIISFTTVALPPPPDTTPPSTPTGLTATPVSSSKIDLSWNSSTDNVAVTGYRIYRDNLYLGAATNTTYQDTGLFSSTIYSYEVSAIDEAGNESLKSIGASTTTPEPPPFNAKINFQLSGTPIPTDHLPDYGSTYADRGNGFTYGWNVNNSANARDRDVNGDQRYDTLNHMQKPSGASIWELQVPSADYQVRIISGDPSYIDSIYKINVENQLVINATPSWGNQFFENTITVSVADGKLTVSNAPGASNNKLSFIEVVSAAPPPPAQADYVIQNLTIAPVSPVENESVSFSATVANQDLGAASSSSFTRLRLDIGNDGTYDITGEDQTTTALAASSSEVETWPNVWTAQLGTHKFEVCADVENTLVESDETNNCTIQIFTISPPPPPTLEVSLTPTIKLLPATSSVRVVDLTAHASGTASGTINYTFYCDRGDPGTDITEPWDAKFDNETSTEKTAVDVCTYSLPGTYSAKVIAERDILAAEARAAIIVKEPPPPGAMGPLYQLSSNPRYFTLDGVNAVYFTGSHTWSNLIDRGTTNPPPAFDYTDYITKLKSWDHNFIRLWAWEPTRDDDATTDNVIYWNAPQPWVRTASSTTPSSTEESSTALDGMPKFDLYTLNEDYFNRLRQRVIEARDNGIYVGIMLFEGYNVDKAAVGPDYGWNAHPFHRSNNINGIDGGPNNDGRGREIHQLPGEGGVQAINDIQKTYVQKVIDTVNDLDNVLYEIANEAPNATTGWQYDLINYIKSYEIGKPAQHPVGMTFQWADGNNTTLFNSPADWISTRDSMTNPPAASGTKVIISDSDHHCGSNCTDGDWVWRDFTRGRNPIYMDDWGTRASSTFYEEKRTSARNAMGQTNLYAKKMNLAAVTPRGDLASTAFALANPGFEYLVYQPNGGSFSVDLSASSTTFSVEWFNVQSGSVTAGGMVNGGAIQNFTSPFGSPAVLYLKEQL